MKEPWYSVFLDREEMRSGEFNKQIYGHIQNAKDIIVLLEEGSLKSITDGIISNSGVKAIDEVSEKLLVNRPLLKRLANNVASGAKNLMHFTQNYKDDWFCMEIMHAIETERNIIPVLLNNYKIPKATDFPEEMKRLAMYQAIDYDYVDDFNELFEKYFIGRKYLKSHINNQLTQFVDSTISKSDNI